MSVTRCSSIAGTCRGLCGLVVWVLACASPTHATEVEPEPVEIPRPEGSSAVREASARARFFMPALEVGPVWSREPEIQLGVLFRTFVEYRFARVRAPFLRLGYDATSAAYRSESSGQSLRARATLHDLWLGGGVRYGPNRVQLVGAVQGGLQIRDLPRLEVDADTVALKSEVSFLPILIGSVGVEGYLFRRVALTGDVSGRVPLSRSAGVSVAFTIGLATSL